MSDGGLARRRLRDLAALRLGLMIPPIHDGRLDQAIAALDLAPETAAGELAPLEELSLDSEAWQRVVRCITVGETNFLRHRQWFAEIEQNVLVPLIDRRRQSGQRYLRLWSAACSTGEEPYTLAMIVDRLIPERRDWQISIFATDINAASLATAREAVYRDWSLRELSEMERMQHFEPLGEGAHRLRPAYRDMVTFRMLNLTEDGFPNPSVGLADLDLIICRNVLMYWTPAVQLATAQRLARSLAAEAWLAVSPAEAVADWYRPLVPVNLPTAILFRKLPLTPAAGARPTLNSRAPSRGSAPASRHRPPAEATAPARPPALRPAPAAVAATANDPIGEARILADRGQLQAARQHCETLLVRDSLDGEANLLLAAVCLELGDLGSALEAARRATYILPRSAAAFFQLGSVQRRLGQAAQARRSMEVVLSLLDSLPDEQPIASLAEMTTASLRQAARACLGLPSHPTRELTHGRSS